MIVLDDIWITLSEVDVLAQAAASAPPDENLARALEAFHRAREAKGVFAFIEPAQSPLALPGAEAGVVAVAATLGAKVEALEGRPWMAACLKAGLFQLEAFIHYRVLKRLAPRRLCPGFPIVPGGALAPQLKPTDVLDLLPKNPSGVRAEKGRLWPTWSLAYLYPVSAKIDEVRTNPCAACHKDCALRRLV